jgi:hypothetical protein
MGAERPQNLQDAFFNFVRKNKVGPGGAVCGFCIERVKVIT